MLKLAVHGVTTRV